MKMNPTGMDVNLKKIAKINQVIMNWATDLQKSFVESWDDFKDAKLRDSSHDVDWELVYGIANVASLAVWFDEMGQDTEDYSFQLFKQQNVSFSSSRAKN